MRESDSNDGEWVVEIEETSSERGSRTDVNVFDVGVFSSDCGVVSGSDTAYPGLFSSVRFFTRFLGVEVEGDPVGEEEEASDFFFDVFFAVAFGDPVWGDEVVFKGNFSVESIGVDSCEGTETVESVEEVSECFCGLGGCCFAPMKENSDVKLG